MKLLRVKVLKCSWGDFYDDLVGKEVLVKKEIEGYESYPKYYFYHYGKHESFLKLILRSDCEVLFDISDFLKDSKGSASL